MPVLAEVSSQETPAALSDRPQEPSEKSKDPTGERIQFLGKQEIPRQIFGIDSGTYLSLVTSLNRQRVVKAYLTGALLVHGKDGELWRQDFARLPDLCLVRNGEEIKYGVAKMEAGGFWELEDYYPDRNPESVNFIEDVWTPARGPWGPFDVVCINFSKNYPYAIDGIEEPFRSKMFRHSGAVAQRLMDETGKPVYVASNHWGNLFESGGQSVIDPHLHIWMMIDEFNDLKPDNYISARQNSLYDEGSSSAIADRVINSLKSDHLYKWPGAQMTLDNMGFTGHFPGFRPIDFAGNFFPDFWEPVAYIIDCQLQAFFARNYDGDLQDVYNLVRQAHINGGLTEEMKAQYLNMFRLKRNEVYSEEGALIKKFKEEGILREPPIWMIGLQFIPGGGMTAVVTFSFLKGKIGPVEGFCVQLDRLKDSHCSPAEIERKKYPHFVGEMITD